VALLLAVFAATAVMAWHAAQDEERATAKAERTEALHARLTYLDEVLTMSARMYAATGEEEFLGRYLANEGPLNDTIDELETVADDREFTHALQLTGDANSALVLLEKDSFRLTQEGRGDEALTLLVGPEYRQHKQDYKSGIDRALADLQAAQEEEQAVLDQRVDRAALAAAAVGMAALGLASFLLVRAARARTRRLAADAAAELERVRGVSEFRTQFLNNAAHELSTPLTPIKLQLATMRHASFGDLSERQRGALELLQRNLDRLGRLVQDLVEAARLLGGKLKLALRPVSLGDLAAEVVATFETKAMQEGVDLQVAAPARPAVVQADPARLSQVLFNLVHNALKFTPRGGHVSLRIAEEGGDVVLEVADTGLGLRPDQVERLFQPFTQVHDPRSLPAPVGGTGLGLYISRGILEQHGGSISVASAGPGQGTTFRVRLPRLVEADAALPGPSGSRSLPTA
jgi:signal transduction histidine kinase